MKKIFLLILILICLLLPSVFAAPHLRFNTFSNPENRISFNEQNSILTINDNIIYNQAYYSINGNAWQAINLSGSAYQGSNDWINSSASASIESLDIEGEHYIIIYSCSYNNGWDCHNTTGRSNGFWQLLVINNSASDSLEATIIASSFQNDGFGFHPAIDAVDNNFSTYWAADGVGEWLGFGFSQPVLINGVSLAFFRGNVRINYFAIETSDDGETWSEVYNGESSGDTESVQTFFFSDLTTRFIRFVGLGNSDSHDWNSLYDLQWLSNTTPIGFSLFNCSDGISNGAENGVDCGGLCAVECPVEPTCYDEILNQDETFTDCGGPCNPCECLSDTSRNCFVENGQGLETLPCHDGVNGSWSVCIPTSCDENFHIFSNSCVDDNCSDGLQNQNELGVDCGGICLDEFGLVCPTTTTYYVSSSEGDNSNNGLSPSTPWRTLGYVYSQSFDPGDAILLKRGDDFREEFNIPSSGSPQAHILISGYSVGSNPRILGSENSSWSAVPGETNIWISDRTGLANPEFTNYRYSSVWFENLDDSVVWGTREVSSMNDLDREYEWYWQDGRVYVFSPIDPDQQYKSIEMSQRHDGIDLNFQDYIEINGIDIHYTAVSGIRDHYPTTQQYGLIVRNCDIGYIGIKDDPTAFGVYTWQNDALIEHNEIHDCGRRSISYFGTRAGDRFTFGGLVVQYNRFYNGWHTTSLDSIIERGSLNSINGVTFRNNIIEEDPTTVRDMVQNPNSNFVFVADQSGEEDTTFSNVRIYNNIFLYASASAIKTEYIVNLSILYNTFYRFNPDIANFQCLSCNKGNENSTTTVKNNIFYHNGVFATNNNLMGIRIDPVMTQGAMDADYNLFHALDPRARLYAIYGGSGSVEGYNLGNFNDLPVIHGLEIHSLVGDPLLLDPDNKDVSLQAGSPAIGNGLPIPWITTDYYGNPRDPVNPTIGAVEYQG